jgi:LacI family transcriptional regulator
MAKEKVSLGRIAKLAGVSTMAVSYALKNQPGVGAATRQRILRLARKLGYAPDARIDGWMARVRGAKSKDLLPIAWLNTAWEKDAWERFLFHTPQLEGAQARAMALGYKLENIWAHEPGMTMKRLARIFTQRGIEGVIVTHPARHLRLDWDRLAGVTIGAALQAPRLHRVMADFNYNLHLALKALRRLGYRRIGICLMREIDAGSQYTLGATARDLYFRATGKDQVPPLFHSPSYHAIEHQDLEIRKAAVVKWLKRYEPEVIVGHDSRMKEWAEGAGFRVPQDIGIVLLAVDDDVLDWAGIHSKRRELGATAVEWLVSLMRNNQYGVPKTPLNIQIRGTWQMGRTLRTPTAM